LRCHGIVPAFTKPFGANNSSNSSNYFGAGRGQVMSRTNRLSACLAVVVLLLLGNFNPAAAQLTRGFISGTISDTTNAVMAGVQVTLTSKTTNISRNTLTNDVGFYRFAAVEPGEYSLEFKSAGFETHRIESVGVNTAQEVVINQILGVSNVSAEISVLETPGVTLDKTMATIERTFSAQTVAEMPLLNGTAR